MNEGIATWYATLPLLLEAKIGFSGGELRSTSIWEFRFSEYGEIESRVSVSLDGYLATSRSSNEVLDLRASLGLDLSHGDAGIEPIGRELAISIVVKFP